MEGPTFAPVPDGPCSARPAGNGAWRMPAKEQQSLGRYGPYFIPACRWARNSRSVANPKFQSNGVDSVIDDVVKHQEQPEDAREKLWQVAWQRGYQDVFAATPVPDSKIDGHVLYSREFPSGRGLVVIDTGEQAVA